MVFAYTSFGYVAPDGTQVNFPYTDRYQDWTIAIEWFSKAKQNFSYYGTGEIAEFYANKIRQMIATNDPILRDAAAQLGASNPFEVFGVRQPTIVDIAPEVASTITGTQLKAIDEAVQSGIIVTSTEQPALITQETIQKISPISGVPLETLPEVTKEIQPDSTITNPVQNLIQQVTANPLLLLIVGAAGYGLYEFFGRGKR